MPPPISAAAEDAADRWTWKRRPKRSALRESQVRTVPRCREDRQQHQPSACLSSLAQDNEEAGELAKIMMSKRGACTTVCSTDSREARCKRSPGRKREEQEGA